MQEAGPAQRPGALSPAAMRADAAWFSAYPHPTTYPAVSRLERPAEHLLVDDRFPQRRIGSRKRIALIAHDNKKPDMLAWARIHREALSRHQLFATGTTGALLTTELELPIIRFRSGPLGGDQQVGAGIVEGAIDLVVFFSDPLEPHPHDVDVKALLRIAVVYDVPIACNRATADFLMSSPLLDADYERHPMTATDLITPIEGRRS